MCSVVGAIKKPEASFERFENDTLTLLSNGLSRGRDGQGVTILIPSPGEGYPRRSFTVPRRSKILAPELVVALSKNNFVNIIGNFRAEPTTEYLAVKSLQDQQPYSLGPWSIVHNGTIANDKELRTGEYPTSIDSATIIELLDRKPPSQAFPWMVEQLKGSFAILAQNVNDSNLLHYACNYKPIWIGETESGVFLGSSREILAFCQYVKMLPPYTYGIIQMGNYGRYKIQYSSIKREHNKKALVVCSGGLDSVVSAVYAQKQLGLDIHLIHFQYGCRAEEQEVAAIRAVANHMGTGLTLFPLPVYKPEDSRLMDKEAAIAGGEQGAEFAHEWVPARNLLLLSVATAYAEANGYSTIVLGNNLEEAGAYPDNEPEFINRFNDILPFAVGDGKQVTVKMPVGNLMKHEIVKLGHTLGAPMHLTWSCYRNGKRHCGKCGPCFMRKTAFMINDIPEVIDYEA